MPLLTADQRAIVQALLHDVVATLAVADKDSLMAELEQQASDTLRLFDWTRHDLSAFASKLVDDVQQRIHDEFLDVSWPRCPRHPHHPMWMRDGAWWCTRDEARTAALGELPPLGTDSARGAS